jgi:hypothetical protein
MQIEETFRDAKNHRFGWSLSDVRTACISRAATLLLLVSIAMLVVTLVGLAAESRGLHRRYRANTLKRRALSLFVLGCVIIRRSDHEHHWYGDIRACLLLIPGLASA